jgi:predicted small lipoprotein YifL
MRTLVFGLILAVALAGCLKGPLNPPDTKDPGPISPGDDDNATRLAGFVPPILDPTLLNVSFSVLRPAGYTGAEPSIGVTSKGNVFITAGRNAVRSTDGGGNWTTVSTQVSAPTSFDPYLWVDQATDRIYHVNLYVANSYMSISQDEGATWITLPAAGGPGDHQKLATGPPSSKNPAAGVAHPSVVYYAVNLLTHTQISVSLDGGATWPSQPASVPTNCAAGGINGQPHGVPSGTAYVPYYDCTGESSGLYAARSEDNGLTWSVVRINTEVGRGVFDPDMASDKAGNTYAVFMAGAKGNHSTYLVASTDDGKTWGKAVRVSPQGLNTTIFPVVVAGDAGRLWIAYYATSDTSAHPNNAADTTKWFLYATHVTDAQTASPNMTTFLLDPHPVQIGRICTGGISCDSNRNLLEFIDASIDPKTGRLWIVYTDGCNDACTAQPASQSRISSVARLDNGPSLWADKGWLEPLGRT